MLSAASCNGRNAPPRRAGPDHLAVADIAALADVDVAPRQLQRVIGSHSLHLLDGALQVEERGDLHDAADGTTTRMPDREKIEFFSKVRVSIMDAPYSAACGAFAGHGLLRAHIAPDRARDDCRP